MKTQVIPFDSQAAYFDDRAGFKPGIAQQIAKNILTYANVSAGETILEIGAGTGEIGQWLARSDLQYIGMDSSNGMLDMFRSRVGSESSAKLIHADANKSWPIEEKVRLIFGSRVFHLLDNEHVLSEISRLQNPNGTFLVMGKVKRKDDSIKRQIRQKMRTLLAQTGHEPRQGDEIRSNLLKKAVSLGATFLEPLEAATWTTMHRPIDSLLSWQNKESMAGIIPSDSSKKEVLDELKAWATKEFGNLEQEVETMETYTLEGVCFKR